MYRIRKSTCLFLWSKFFLSKFKFMYRKPEYDAPIEGFKGDGR